MTEIIKEITTTRGNDTRRVVAVETTATAAQTIGYLVYFFFGAAETLLAFRLILKLLGASPASGFVDFIYGVTGIFIAPFEGIFRTAVSQGIETRSVLEPATIVAIVVYTVVAWGIVELVRISSGEKQTA